MNQGYNNPIVTYDEIVDALKSIIECSLNSNYIDDFNYLNVKYESEVKTKVDGAEEKALYNAIKSLEHTLDSASKIIKSGLERELIDIEKNIFKIRCDYLIGQEKRKLSAQQHFIQKLKESSLKIDVLYQAPQYEESDDIVALDSLKDIDTNKVFSDFEKKVIVNFPDFFKEELAIANESEKDIDKTDLFDTIETDPIMQDDYNVPEELELTSSAQKNNNRIHLINIALKKARQINNKFLIQKLENQLAEELNKNKE